MQVKPLMIVVRDYALCRSIHVPADPTSRANNRGSHVRHAVIPSSAVFVFATNAPPFGRPHSPGRGTFEPHLLSLRNPPVTFILCRGMACMQKIGWPVDMPRVGHLSIRGFSTGWHAFNQSVRSTWLSTLAAEQEHQRSL